jgi:hypothetical protein
VDPFCVDGDSQVPSYNKKYRFFTSVVVILAVREVVLLVAESPGLVTVQFVLALSHTLFMEVPSCVPGFRMQPALLCAQRIVLGAILASYVRDSVCKVEFFLPCRSTRVLLCPQVLHGPPRHVVVPCT